MVKIINDISVFKTFQVGEINIFLRGNKADFLQTVNNLLHYFFIRGQIGQVVFAVSDFQHIADGIFLMVMAAEEVKF